MRALLLAASILLTGCPLGLGERCSGEGGGECPAPLVCTPVEEGNPVGICDYPLLAEGRACTQAARCEAGLTCSNHFTAGERYGTCVAARASGEQCLMDRDCASGACEGASTEALGLCR